MVISGTRCLMLRSEGTATSVVVAWYTGEVQDYVSTAEVLLSQQVPIG